MEQLKNLKQQFISQVQGQMGNLANVDAKEMGEVIDIIKDLDEAIYYCTITEAMEKSKKEEQHEKYYSPYPPYERCYPYDIYRDMDIDSGRMYYTPNGTSSDMTYNNNPTNGGGNRQYVQMGPTMRPRDSREGRSPIQRKNYMESKAMHQDKAKQMKELENYMKELSVDLTEMIEDATPEERQILKQKMAQLLEMI